MTDNTAATSTDPAAASLAAFAFSCLSGEARSTVASIAVFISSNETTSAIEKKDQQNIVAGNLQPPRHHQRHDGCCDVNAHVSLSLHGMGNSCKGVRKAANKAAPCTQGISPTSSSQFSAVLPLDGKTFLFLPARFDGHTRGDGESHGRPKSPAPAPVNDRNPGLAPQPLATK